MRDIVPSTVPTGHTVLQMMRPRRAQHIMIAASVTPATTKPATLTVAGRAHASTIRANALYGATIDTTTETPNRAQTTTVRNIANRIFDDGAAYEKCERGLRRIFENKAINAPVGHTVEQ